MYDVCVYAGCQTRPQPATAQTIFWSGSGPQPTLHPQLAAWKKNPPAGKKEKGRRKKEKRKKKKTRKEKAKEKERKKKRGTRSRKEREEAAGTGERKWGMQSITAPPHRQGGKAKPEPHLRERGGMTTQPNRRVPLRPSIHPSLCSFFPVGHAVHACTHTYIHTEMCRCCLMCVDTYAEYVCRRMAKRKRCAMRTGVQGSAAPTPRRRRALSALRSALCELAPARSVADVFGCGVQALPVGRAEPGNSRALSESTSANTAPSMQCAYIHRYVSGMIVCI